MDEQAKSVINHCLSGIKNRDDKFIDLLYEVISPTIRFIAMKYLQNSFDSDDLVQDFWADIYKIADNFVFVQNGYMYLCKTMTRMALNRYCKLHHDRQIEVRFVDYHKELVIGEDEAFIDDLSLRTMVDAAMDELTDTEKLAVQLTFFESKTVRGMGEEMNMSKSSAGLLKLTAVDKLRKSLEYYLDKSD